MKFSHQPVTVMGLGHFGGGVGAARWLAEQEAEVTVTDLATAEQLARPLAELVDMTLAAVHLGGHCEEDFASATLVVVNPAVRLDNPFLQIAARNGARLTTEIELFIEACPAPIIAVTGSNGKSTTAAMIAAVLRADGRLVYLGGNIGGSLLMDLPQIKSDDWVVLELSSFQLAHLGNSITMPHVAVITNFSPNHLNWHDTLANYRTAKQRLLSGQSSRDIAVLDNSLLETNDWSDCVTGRLLRPADWADLPALHTPGEHNLRNAALAAAAARAAGCSQETIARGLGSFQTLPGRLQLVATVEHKHYYNDTTATTPESTIAAVKSLDVKSSDGSGSATWLLAGGSDKGVALDAMAAAIVNHTRGAAFFGTTASRLQKLCAAKSADFTTIAVRTLEEAFTWCRETSREGDRILLSPGCASLDQFRNFRYRGERFEELVLEYAETPLTKTILFE